MLTRQGALWHSSPLLPGTTGRAVSIQRRSEVRYHVKTKGALMWELNQPWSIEEIEIGDPVKDEVKIQMEAAGMCHSDHHLVTGGIPMGGFPVLGGHEGAGIVTEVGPGVEDIAPGDHVGVSFMRSAAIWGPPVRGCSTAQRYPTARSGSRPAAKTSSR